MTMSSTTTPIELLDDEDRPRTNRPWPSESEWPAFLGSWHRLRGRQQPAVETWHEGDETEGDQCTRFGVRIGLRCMPWEWMVVRAILSRLPADEWGIRKWTHRNVVLECTRQQGKTLILILIILWRLFKKRERIVYTAQQWTTVEDVFDRVVAVIERVPSLRRRLAAKPSKKDNRGVIYLGGRAKADFGPRTQHFARGFTEIDLLILDEAYDLVPKEVANLTGAQAASDNAQTIYASTPPVVSEHPNCGRFAGFVRTILAGGAPALYGALYRAPAHFRRGDPRAYPFAQPSFGVVADEREMEAHLQGAKDSGPVDLALFDADWLGWGDYPPPPSQSVSEISTTIWENMKAKPETRLVGPVTVALERGANGLWSINAAWRTNGGRSHIEVGYCQSAPTAVIVERVTTLIHAWNPSALVVRSRSAAAELLPDLEKAGLEATVVNSTDVAQACGGFLNAALDGMLSHTDQDELNTAVANAVKHELPSGGFVWEVTDAASFPQLMGASLAHWALTKFGKVDGPPPSPSFERAPRQHGFAMSIDDFDPMTAVF